MTVSLQQLSLDISQAPPARFHNFITGKNIELRAHLASLTVSSEKNLLTPAQRLTYIWGEVGSGRTHLLGATQDAFLQQGLSSRLLTAESELSDFMFNSRDTLYCVDDVEQLSAEQEIALFNLYNSIRDSQLSDLSASPLPILLVTGSAAPLGLAVREDLRTRLGWGLVYQVHALEDEDKIAALQNAAKERGLVLSAEVPTWLMRHFYRDMPSLMALLDTLDTYSLEQKRAVTLPLVKQLLQGI